MAQLSGLKWEELDESARDVLGWAVAATLGPEVGSRGLLLGVLRAERPSELETLLIHSGSSPDALVAALLERASPKRFDPRVERPAFVDQMPKLTTNAEAALARAAQMQRDWPSTPVGRAAILGALLELPISSATRALATAVGETPLQQLGLAYLGWLRRGGLTWHGSSSRRNRFSALPLAPRPRPVPAASQSRRPPRRPWRAPTGRFSP